MSKLFMYYGSLFYFFVLHFELFLEYYNLLEGSYYKMVGVVCRLFGGRQ